MKRLTTGILAALLAVAAVVPAASAADQFMFRPPEKAKVLPKAAGVFLPGVPGVTLPSAPSTPTTPSNPGTTNPTNPGTTNPTDPGTTNPTNPGTGTPTTPGNPVSPISLSAVDIDVIRFMETQDYGLRFNLARVTKFVSSQGSALPSGLYWREDNRGIVGMPMREGTTPVWWQVQYQVDGIPTTLTERVEWNITVGPQKSELAVLQGPISMKSGYTYKGRTATTVSGRFEDRGGMTSKVYYKWTGLPGQVKQTYNLPKPDVWLEGYVGAPGIYQAEVEVTEELWSATPQMFSASNNPQKATVIGHGTSTLRQTNKAKKAFEIEVVNASTDTNTTGNMFRITVKNPQDYATSSVSEFVFTDRALNVLPIKSITSNRFLKPGSAPFSALFNGVRNVLDEVVTCPTAACDTGNTYSSKPAVFVVEFENQVKPFYFNLYSNSAFIGGHIFYSPATRTTPELPIIERSVDGGQTWGEITTLINTTKPTTTNKETLIRVITVQ